MDGKATILVISPLNSIIKDQLDEMRSQGYPAVDATSITPEEIRQCNVKIMYATAEKVKEKSFREVLKNSSSPLHQNICAIVVDESHRIEAWTGKRLGLCVVSIFEIQ